MLRTDTQRQTKNMPKLKFGFQKSYLPASHTICYLHYRTVHLSASFMNQLAEWHDIWRHIFEGNQTLQASFSYNYWQQHGGHAYLWKISNTGNTYLREIKVYCFWNIIYCLQRCVFEVQGEGKFNVQLSVIGIVLEWKGEWMGEPIHRHWMWRV